MMAILFFVFIEDFLSVIFLFFTQQLYPSRQSREMDNKDIKMDLLDVLHFDTAFIIPVFGLFQSIEAGKNKMEFNNS